MKDSTINNKPDINVDELYKMASLSEEELKEAFKNGKDDDTNKPDDLEFIKEVSNLNDDELKKMFNNAE